MNIRVLEIKKDNFEYPKLLSENIEDVYSTIGIVEPDIAQQYLHCIVDHEIKHLKNVIKNKDERENYWAVFDVDTDVRECFDRIKNLSVWILCEDNKYIGHVYTWSIFEGYAPRSFEEKEREKDCIYVQGIRKCIFEERYLGIGYYLIDAIMKNSTELLVSVVEPLESMQHVLKKFGFVKDNQYFTLNKRRFHMEKKYTCTIEHKRTLRLQEINDLMLWIEQTPFNKIFSENSFKHLEKKYKEECAGNAEDFFCSLDQSNMKYVFFGYKLVDDWEEMIVDVKLLFGMFPLYKLNDIKEGLFEDFDKQGNRALCSIFRILNDEEKKKMNNIFLSLRK
jgi:hypothetical protein